MEGRQLGSRRSRQCCDRTEEAARSEFGALAKAEKHFREAKEGARKKNEESAAKESKVKRSIRHAAAPHRSPPR